MECCVEEKLEKIAACAYICEMTHGFENPQFLDLIQCYVYNNCLAEYPRDGICYGEDKDGIKNFKSMDQVKHDFHSLVLRSINLVLRLRENGG